jgi:hypothetical protein
VRLGGLTEIGGCRQIPTSLFQNFFFFFFAFRRFWKTKQLGLWIVQIKAPQKNLGVGFESNVKDVSRQS